MEWADLLRLFTAVSFQLGLYLVSGRWQDPPAQRTHEAVAPYDDSMAIFTADAVTGAAGSSATITPTVGAGTNRLLVAWVDDETSVAPWTGPLTAASTVAAGTIDALTTDGAGNAMRFGWWLDADLPSNADPIIVAAPGGDSGVAVHAALFTGANQAAPVMTAVQALTQTQHGNQGSEVRFALDTAAGDLVVAAAAHGGGGTATAMLHLDVVVSDVPASSTVYRSAYTIEDETVTGRVYAIDFSSTSRATGIAAVFRPAAPAGVSVALSGQLTAAASNAGALTAAKQLAAGTAAAAGLRGALSVARTHALSGSIHAAAANRGKVRRTQRVRGSAAGAAGLRGALSVARTRALSGSIHATAANGGDVVRTRALDGGAAAAGASEGTLTAAKQLTAGVAAAARLRGVLSVARTQQLAGVMAGAAGLRGALSITRTRRLSGSIHATAVCTPLALSRQRTSSGRVHAAGDVGGDPLARFRQMSGGTAAAVRPTAELDVARSVGLGGAVVAGARLRGRFVVASAADGRPVGIVLRGRSSALRVDTNRATTVDIRSVSSATTTSG